MKQSSFLKFFLASLTSGTSVFLFLYATELVLTYWFGKQIRAERLLYYSVTYAIIGAVTGIGIAIARLLLARVMSVLVAVQHDKLFVAVDISGFLGFLSVLFLNTACLPNASILSKHTIYVNVALIGLLFLGFLFLYVMAASPASKSTLPMVMSVGVSVAVALAFLHAIISRKIGRAGVPLSSAAGLTLLFVVTGFAVAVVDMKVSGLITRWRRNASGGDSFPLLLLGKTVVIVMALPIVINARGYKPLVAEGGRGYETASHQDKPNIIIIVLDTVRQDRLSTYGCERETSPNITKFANESWKIDAYATEGWTLPSHASIVTGLFPTETGTGSEGSSYIDERNETMAEILRRNGYSTAAIIANWGVLSNVSGFAQGFDYYNANPRETGLAFPFFATYLLEKFLRNSPAITVLFFQRAEKINQEALRWIKENNRNPFFLFLNFMDAHVPYSPPPPYNRRWYDKPQPAGLGAGLWLEEKLKGLSSGEDHDEVWAYLLSQYDGEIAYLDAQIGALLSELKKSGIYNDSLIVLTSDHGEYFSEHGLHYHPPVVYQEGLRVPLIIKPPATRKELSPGITKPVSLVDLFHSILQSVAIPHQSREGAADLFRGESSPVFSEGHFLKGHEANGQAVPQLYSLVKNSYKLIYSSQGIYNFYKLSEDPHEAHDLLAETILPEDAVVLEQMKDDLARQIQEVTSHRLVAVEPPQNINDEIRSKLRALGYVQ